MNCQESGPYLLCEDLRPGHQEVAASLGAAGRLEIFIMGAGGIPWGALGKVAWKKLGKIACFFFSGKWMRLGKSLMFGTQRMENGENPMGEKMEKGIEPAE